MYKYTQTTDVEVGDLVMWTELLPNNPHITKDKVYQVIDKNSYLIIITDDKGKQGALRKASGFKVLQTKSADQAVVGDYMYRISSGPLAFPQHTVIKITKKSTKELFYTPTRSVWPHEVIVIAQAEENKQEKEKSYPYFIQGRHNTHPMLVRQDKDSYTYLYVKSEVVGKTFRGAYPALVPCDFTIEPEVFDLDWWQQRFEAGLPVYATDQTGYPALCKGLSPKEWKGKISFSMTDTSQTQKVSMSKEDIELFKQQVPLSILHSGLYREIPLGATADCNLQSTIPLCIESTCEISMSKEDIELFKCNYAGKQFSLGATTECSLHPTIKEKPMTFQDFINSLFTEEIKTDYEKKPNFLVAIYNSKGTEIAITTATSVKSVEDTLQSSPKLWGSKAVMYSIDSEVQVSVPVVTTKFKKPKEEK